jgi:hypothetical protein
MEWEDAGEVSPASVDHSSTRRARGFNPRPMADAMNEVTITPQFMERQMRSISDDQVRHGYREFTAHVLEMHKPNNYAHLAESFAYAKMRAEDFRREYNRRELRG